MCQKELLLIGAEPQFKTCHGIVTIRKELAIDDERGDLMRKRRAPSNIVVSERKGKRYEYGYCEYESRAQYITARHVARVHQRNIEPTKCDLCPFKTIYRSNLKKHQERMHNTQVEIEVGVGVEVVGVNKVQVGCVKEQVVGVFSCSIKLCFSNSGFIVYSVNDNLFYFFVVLLYSLFNGLPSVTISCIPMTKLLLDFVLPFRAYQ